MWIYVVVILAISLAVSLFNATGIRVSLYLIPASAGILSILFWLFIVQRPIIELYSKNYPYRKLKMWGFVLSLIFFEFVLIWGLESKQIKLLAEELFLIIVIFAGTIAFYHSFVRMKVSLRFVLLGVFIPILAMGTALGLGKYFGFLSYKMPALDVAKTVFANTLYWMIFNILFQLICEEPAFRGFIMQRLMTNGKIQAVIISSIIYSLWYVPISFWGKTDIQDLALILGGNFIKGCLFALLFIKGKNLLIAAVSHGIINGLRNSVLSAQGNPGLGQYFQISSFGGQRGFLLLWFGCLLVGVIVVLLTPQKISYRAGYIQRIRGKQ